MRFEVFNEVFLSKDILIKNLEKLFPENNEMFVNIIFVSKNDIRELNMKFREKNDVTDVLSFKLSEEIAEIYICSDYIKENFPDYEKEIVRTILHGILHIRGYSHKGYFNEKNTEEEMFQVQERYLKHFYDILKK